MQETEAKFFVHNLEKIEMRLQGLEARLLQPRLLEQNIRFDLPDGRLRAEGRVLRLRRDAAIHITYKDPSTRNEGVMSRRELEFEVSDWDIAKSFLEALGYWPFFHYEKYRRTYEFGDCHIMLDELPYGNFVEIEGETVEAIKAVSDQLCLNWDAAIAASYHELFERLYGTQNNLDPMRLTFAVLNGLKITPDELSVHPADGERPGNMSIT